MKGRGREKKHFSAAKILRALARRCGRDGVTVQWSMRGVCSVVLIEKEKGERRREILQETVRKWRTRSVYSRTWYFEPGEGEEVEDTKKPWKPWKLSPEELAEETLKAMLRGVQEGRSYWIWDSKTKEEKIFLDAESGGSSLEHLLIVLDLDGAEI